MNDATDRPTAATRPPETNDTPDVEYDLETEERDDRIIGVAMTASLAVLLVVGVLIGGGFAVHWWLKPSDEPVLTETDQALPSLPVRPQLAIPHVPFTDVTRQAGIDFVHENGAYGDKLLPETMGGGAAFLDIDADGDPDLLLVNSCRWPWDIRPPGKTPPTLRLYTNDGAGRFNDVTADWGLDIELYGMGCAVGDFDNDGRVDLFISTVGSNRLFRNTGSRFEDVTGSAGVAGGKDEWSSSCGFFDYDDDGDLDLFVCNYVRWSKDFDLGQDHTLDGKLRAYGAPQTFPGTYPYLYRNDGDGRFTDVSAEAGVQIDQRDSRAPLAKSLGVTFADLNRDGRIDFVVANDTVQNFLFVNQGDGKFAEHGGETGVGYDPGGKAQGAMGVDCARFRNTDDVGIAIGNFTNESTALYVCQSLSRDLPQFRDEAIANGISPLTRLELTFGVFFFDSDLDGRLDLFAANGHLEEDINLVQKSQHYRQPPQLLWNCGLQHANEFVELSVEQCGEDFVSPMVGRGATFADIDADGDLDILITAVGAAPRLLRNDQDLGHHWLRVRLVGRQVNRDAIGSVVDLHVGDHVAAQQVMPTRSYLSQVELPVTFGLGTTDHIDKLVVRWSDGTTRTIENPEVDQLLVIEQKE